MLEAINDSRNELEGKIKDSPKNGGEKAFKQTLGLLLTSLKNEILFTITKEELPTFGGAPQIK